MKVRDYGIQQKDILLNEEGVHLSTRIGSKEHMPCSTVNSYFGTGSTNSMPTFMETHPYMWSKEDVYTWLDWCKREYALSEVPLEKFSMNGKALCVLTKEDFKERAPNVGDVLFNTLQQFASTNLHPSFRNGLPHLLPQMATPAGLLMPAAAAAMCNTFIPAAHLQQFLAQAYPAPMTPDSSPSAPSVSSSNPTPPRNVSPVNHDQRPVIVVTEPSGKSSIAAAADLGKIPVGVLDSEPATSSPNTRSVHSSPRQPSPHVSESDFEIHRERNSPNNTDNLPLLRKEHHVKAGDVARIEGHGGEQPLNLSRKPSESLPTPSPPLLTPHIKPELPAIPGAGLQAAFKAHFHKNLPSTATATVSRQLLTVPGTHQNQPLGGTGVSSPRVPLVIQKINQSGGEMTVSPDPKFAINQYGGVRTPAIQGLVKEIKKEPGTESLDLSQQNHVVPQHPGQPSFTDHTQSQQKAASLANAPQTPTYDPISPYGDEDLETPFSPPVTPGGTLLGFTPGTPNGAISPGRPDGSGKLLWEFLSELLNDPTHQSDPKPIVRWIDMNTYTFQILDTGRLSSLWGQQKNRGTMNYEKLSRALRYYKKVGIIEKATGKRLTYKFMKPPSSIKRGQRGARPGVPRKNRRQSFLQSQQSVNEEGGNSPHKEEHISAGTGSATPFTVANMPQLMASGALKTPLEHVMRTEAMGLTGLPLSSGNVAMLAGLPIVVPSTSLHFNGALSNPSATAVDSMHTNSMTQSVSSSANISPKPETKLPEPEIDPSEDPAALSRSTPDQSATDSEHDSSDSVEAEKNITSGDESAKPDDEMKNDEKKTIDNKAVHLGMPVPVPMYNPNIKTKSRSLLTSLSKRRLLSSGDGSTQKKMPRLILPKASEKACP